MEKLEPTSFVTLDELKDHLAVIAVFNKVHFTVQPGGVLVDDKSGLPVLTPSTYLFLSRAQHRFDLWISRVLKNDFRGGISSLQIEEIPPLDVLMFLHAYMLSPWNFYEDCNRVYPELLRLRFPLAAVRSMIDVNTATFLPTEEGKAFWESKTGTPFDIPFQTEAAETVEVTCPKCSSAASVPWINKAGTGFGQIGFSARCNKCELAISQDTFVFARFLNDLSDEKSFLAHSLLNQSGEVDIVGSKVLKNAIRLSLGDLTTEGSDKYDWKISSITSRIIPDDLKLISRINYVVQAYHQPSQPSMDLGSAVLRQARSIRQMNVIGSQVFSGDEKILPSALVRYHQWLHLGGGALVPAPDIDLVFHTHQLHGTDFRKDSLTIVGHFLNHDDSSDRSVIVSQFNDTKKKWLARYGSIYMAGTQLCSDVCNTCKEGVCNTAPPVSN